MRSFALVAAALASSAAAITVTFPTDTSIWTTVGPNKLTWSSVATDRQNFTALLVTPSLQSTELAALVNTVDGSMDVFPPSNGFIIGTDYVVNLVDPNNKGILAQSGKFDIVAGTGTLAATASGFSSASSTRPVTVTPPAPAATTTNAGPATVDPAPAPSKTSSAYLTTSASGLLLGLASAVYAFVL